MPLGFSFGAFSKYFIKLKQGNRRGRKETDLNKYKKDKHNAIDIVRKKYNDKHLEYSRVKEQLKEIDQTDGKSTQKFQGLDRTRKNIVIERKKLRN